METRYAMFYWYSWETWGFLNRNEGGVDWEMWTNGQWAKGLEKDDGGKTVAVMENI